MAKLLSQHSLAFSKRDYLIDIWDNGAMVVHRQKSAVAIGSLQEGQWCLAGGKKTLLRAAVVAIGGVLCEESVAA